VKIEWSGQSILVDDALNSEELSTMARLVLAPEYLSYIIPVQTDDDENPFANLFHQQALKNPPSSQVRSGSDYNSQTPPVRISIPDPWPRHRTVHEHGVGNTIEFCNRNRSIFGALNSMRTTYMTKTHLRASFTRLNRKSL
jgi:hypothetical protein